MGKWHFPLWFSVLCLLAACGSGAPPSEEVGTQEAAPDVVSETRQENIALSAGDSTAATSQPNPSEPEADTAQPLTSASSPETSPSNEVASAPAVLTDTIVVPGERVGPVTLETTRTDLAELFGEDALEDTEIPVGEGFTEPGTTVNAGTEQAFAIIWTDETKTQPATVKDFGSAWQTPEGLKLGTPFSELENILGGFSLYGLAWDYEGTVVLEESDLEDYYGLLILRMRPTPEAIKQFPDEYQAVTGDKLLSSDDPNLAPLNLSVYEMIVYLTPLVQ